MKESTGNRGRCLCGAVTICAPGMSKELTACHCGMCQRWSGGPLLSVDCGSDVAFGGEENISVYESSAWAERGFCKHCGTHLFYRLKESQRYALPIGLFDSREGIVFKSQIFVDRKPAFYRFADETENLTEAEVFAKYAASSSA